MSSDNGLKEMKKKRQRLMYIVLSFIVVAVMVASLFVGLGPLVKKKAETKSSAKATVISNAVTATVKKASFGSLVNVQLTSEGKKSYPDAKRFQVCNDTGKPVSAEQDLGKDTTVFPVVSANIVVKVKILKADNSEIATVQAKLKK